MSGIAARLEGFMSPHPLQVNSCSVGELFNPTEVALKDWVRL